MKKTTKPSSKDVENEPKASKAAPVHGKVWAFLFLLLLPIGLFLPLIAELIQTLLIGDEYVCCMPDNLQQLLARAEVARELRWLSNIIIGGGMVAGIAIVVFAFIMLRRYALQSLSESSRRIISLILLVVCVYIVLVLASMFVFFVLHNDYYFKYRPWPGGGLYDDAWFSPIDWMRASFANLSF